MKKTAIALIFALLFGLAVGAVKAEYPIFDIESPLPYPGEIYQETSILIQVHREFSPFEAEPNSVDIYYSLDGDPKTKLNITTYGISSDLFGIGTLDNLTDGFHTMEAYSTDTQGNTISDSTTFQVNTTIRFPQFLLSPMNTTYYSKEIPLTYTIDDSKYVVYYRIDNYGTYLIDDNSTLPEYYATEGHHTITAKAYDLKGTMYSKQKANFTIDTTNPFPTSTPISSPIPGLEPFSTILVAALVAAIAIIGTSLFVYLKKRKR